MSEAADGDTGVDLYIQEDRFRVMFAADVAPEVAELMAAPADSMRSNRHPSRADPARSDRHLRVRDLGCADAIRRDFDVVGIAMLAVITTLRGGILRDLILGRCATPAFTQSASSGAVGTTTTTPHTTPISTRGPRTGHHRLRWAQRVSCGETSVEVCAARGWQALLDFGDDVATSEVGGTAALWAADGGVG